LISVNAALPSLALSCACPISRIDTMDSLSDKQTTKGLALTIGILVLVMLALILVSNIL
jgi:hypothetical protein